jgi:hypothetical protein
MYPSPAGAVDRYEDGHPIRAVDPCRTPGSCAERTWHSLEKVGADILPGWRNQPPIPFIHPHQGRIMKGLSHSYPRVSTLLPLVLAFLAACETVSTPTQPQLVGGGPSAAVTSAVPAKGTASTLDFGTWNLEWFGDTSEGPGDEALQLENVRGHHRRPRDGPLVGPGG